MKTSLLFFLITFLISGILTFPPFRLLSMEYLFFGIFIGGAGAMIIAVIRS